MTIHADRKRHTRKLQIELLENRALLACVLTPGIAAYDSSSGILSIEGTNGSDQISVGIVSTDPDGVPATGDETSGLVVTLNGAEVANCSLLDATNPLNGLEINGGNGHDAISIDDAVLIDARVDGGNGHDSIDGGGGNDTLVGGNGKDSLDGASGDDLLDGGNAADLLIGGDGTDELRGGNGPDALEDADSDSTFDGGNGPDTINGTLDPTRDRGRGRGRGRGRP